eukprot:1413878-Pleurochrysis_carterae.AAC.3
MLILGGARQVQLGRSTEGKVQQYTQSKKWKAFVGLVVRGKRMAIGFIDGGHCELDATSGKAECKAATAKLEAEREQKYLDARHGKGRRTEKRVVSIGLQPRRDTGKGHGRESGSRLAIPRRHIHCDSQNADEE